MLAWNVVQKPKWVELPAPSAIPAAVVALKATIAETYKKKRHLADELREKELNPEKAEAAESSNQRTNMKNNLMEKITEEERGKVAEAVQKMREKYRQHEERSKKKICLRILAMLSHVTEPEVNIAMKEFTDDECEIIAKLSDPDYLASVRQQLTTRKCVITAEQIAEHKARLRTRQNLQQQSHAPGQRNGLRVRRFPRLLLNDALASDQSDWSDARIKAYAMIEVNPNSYYYRFNAPGEPQKNGAWTQEEQDLFMKCVEERGGWEKLDGKWGLFSMKIPGRVGYQCSNYYRKLVASNMVPKHNYVFDENGKMHHRTRKGAGGIPPENKVPKIKKKIIKIKPEKKVVEIKPKKEKKEKRDKKKKKDKKPKKRGRNSRDEIRACDVSSESEYDDESSDSCSSPKKRRGGSKKKADEMFEQEQEDDGDDDPNNPLRDMKDPIDYEPMRKPAISPSGHVMSYDNWVQCLVYTEPKNICPFTKQPLTIRQLVKLTFDNIDQYRDQIVAL